MTGHTDVYLITGFLGSGKTTFLNKVIRQFPQDKKLMILMNEFGEIGVDGTLIEAQELELLEISKGSIFCACVKTDFIKGLYEIAEKIRPDVLIIESTGVANPGDLKKDLELPIFNNRFELKEQFCLIDAVHFLEEFSTFASVEKQIASSTRFIINKIDLAVPEQIEEIKAVVKRYHPNPKFYETTYASVDFGDLFFFAGKKPSSYYATDSNKEFSAAGKEMTPDEIERYVEELINDPKAEVLPPDILMSATFSWNGGELGTINELSQKLPKGVVRAKGFLLSGGRVYLYNYVLGGFSLKEHLSQPNEEQKNILVLILTPQIFSSVVELLGRYGFVKKGDLSPGEIALEKIGVRKEETPMD